MNDTPAVWTRFPAEQQEAMDKRAAAAARKEYEHDLNRTDPKHTQDRVEAALKDLRVRLGYEKA